MKEDILEYLQELKEKYNKGGKRDIAKQSIINKLEQYIKKYKNKERIKR